MANIISQWLNPNNFTVLRDKFNAVVTALSDGVTGQVLQKSGNGNGEFTWSSILDAFPVGFVISNQLTTTPFSAKYIPLKAQTVGNSSSTADLADDLNEEIFTFIYNNISDGNAPVSGGRSGDAATDFAASKKITLPDTRGRSFIDSDDRSSDPSNGIWDVEYQNLGYTAGEKDHLLVPDETAIRNHKHFPNNQPSQFIILKAGGGLGIGAGSGTTAVTDTADITELDALDAHETRHPFIIGANSMIKYRA